MDIANPNKVVENNNRDNMMNDNEKYMIEMHIYSKNGSSTFVINGIC